MTKENRGLPCAMIFDNHHKALESFNQHVLMPSVLSFNKHRMTLVENMLGKDREIHFISIKEENDRMKVCGMAFRFVRFDECSYFSGRNISFVMSRVRYPKDD